MANAPHQNATRTVCSECGGPIDGVRFCPDCGQAVTVAPLQIRSIANNVVGSITDLELPILRTAWEMIWRPGHVAAAWLDGKRRTYANPVKFCVIAGVLVTLTFRLVLPEASASTPPDQSAFSTFIQVVVRQYFAFFALLFHLPIAAVVRVFGRLLGVERSWIDWYALGLYTIGFTVLLQFIYAGFSELLTLPQISGTFPVIWYLWGSWGFALAGQRWRSLAACTLGVATLLGGTIIVQLML